MRSQATPTVLLMFDFKYSSSLYLGRGFCAPKSGFTYTRSMLTKFLSLTTLLIIWQAYRWVRPSRKRVAVWLAMEGSRLSMS